MIIKLKLLPDSTKAHVRAAVKEMLLALRDLVDAHIKLLEPREEAKEKKAEIEVEE